MPHHRAALSVLRRLRELAVVSVATLTTLLGLMAASEAHARVLYSPERDRLHQAEQGLERVSRGMLDQETGVRGYLNGGDDVFLEPYRKGQHEVLTGCGELAAALQDRRGLALFNRLQETATRWQQEYGGPVVTVAQWDLADAADRVEAEHGRHLFDAFRAARGELEAHLRARTDEVAAERERVRGALLAAAVSVLLVLALVGSHEIRSARRLLEAPVQQLAARARSAAAGEEPPAAQGLPLELAAIGAGVDVLVAQLAEARRVGAEQRAQLQRATRATSLLLDQTRLLSSTSGAPMVAAATGEAARALLDGPESAVWLVGAEGVELAYCSEGRTSRPDPATGALGATPSVAAARALHFGRAFQDAVATVVAAPMISDGRTLGVVEVALAPGATVDSRDFDNLQVLLSQGAAALAASTLLARTSELSLRDPLTGLANRRRLELDLDQVAGSSALDVGLLVVDVDHFKRFNDTRGHAAGDDLLRALADVLGGAVRGEAGDSVYRYGGEEFVVLLRGCPLEGLAQSAERVRESVARRLAADGVTVSVGAASRSEHPLDELFAAADAALYRAKSEGRNRVVVADPRASGGALALGHGRAGLR